MKKYIYIILIAVMTLSALAEDEAPKRALNLPLEMQQLMATRERAIADIDVKFERAVRELRAEFRQKGDTRAVLQLDAWLVKNDDPVLGEWVFHAIGNPGTLYRFDRNGSWSRPAGEAFETMQGRWERRGNVVLVWREDPDKRYSTDASKPLAELHVDEDSGMVAWSPLQGRIRMNGTRPSATPVPVAKTKAPTPIVIPPRQGSNTLGQEVQFFQP